MTIEREIQIKTNERRYGSTVGREWKVSKRERRGREGGGGGGGGGKVKGEEEEELASQ